MFAWYYTPEDRPPLYLWWIAASGFAQIAVGVGFWLVLLPSGAGVAALGFVLSGFITLGFAAFLSYLQHVRAPPDSVRAEAARNATIALFPVFILAALVLTANVLETGSVLPPVPTSNVQVTSILWDIPQYSVNCSVPVRNSPGFTVHTGSRVTLSQNLQVSGPARCRGVLLENASVYPYGFPVVRSNLPLAVFPSNGSALSLTLQVPSNKETTYLIITLLAGPPV